MSKLCFLMVLSLLPREKEPKAWQYQVLLWVWKMEMPRHCKLIWPLWRAAWQWVLKLKMGTSHASAVSLLRRPFRATLAHTPKKPQRMLVSASFRIAKRGQPKIERGIDRRTNEWVKHSVFWEVVKEINVEFLFLLLNFMGFFNLKKNFFFLATLQLVGSWFLNQASNPGPWQWKHRILATGSPGNSLNFMFLICTLHALIRTNLQWVRPYLLI